ncbi:MAG TPA: rhomboid family intramembrane serine protease [Pseudomonadales bacterium]|nr:rhomboid family intramembrane serine protease [Pseudomonadales bacterium]
MVHWAGEKFPTFDGSGWALWNPPCIEHFDSARALAEAVRRKSGLVLVGVPGGQRLVPPETAQGLPASARFVAASRLEMTAYTVLVLALLQVALALWVQRTEPLGFAVSALGLAVLCYAEARSRRRDPGFALERAKFFLWMQRDRQFRFAGIACVVALSAVGLAQVIAQHLLGGQLPLWERIGVVYPLVREGEYLRLLSGPFLHYSFVHFAVNLAGLCIAFPLVVSLLGPLRGVAYPLLVNAIAAAAQLALGGDQYDNMGGLSGGLYGLMGLIAVVGMAVPGALPAGLGRMTAFVSVFGIVGAELGSGTAATTCHVAGLLSGVALGAIEARRLRASAAACSRVAEERSGEQAERTALP